VARFNAMTMILSLVAASLGHAVELSEQELRGKQIYRRGESPSGAPITAIVARGAVPISATILPCSGCHGEDGKGRPEGGVNPSDITWSVLTASYGHDHDYGRSHPAFDASTLARAIAEGIDPGDNALDLAMPRYSAAPSDMEDLVAYLRMIASDLDPGLTSDSIRLGTLLPREGVRQGIGESMNAVLAAMFDDVNASGGIHGRRLELVVGEYDPDQGEWNARDFLNRESVFALVSGYLGGVEKQVADLVEEDQVPLIGPYTIAPSGGDGLHRFSFYLLGGLTQQGRVLAKHAAAAPGNRRLAIIHPNGTAYAASVQSVRKESLAGGSEPVVTAGYQPPYFDAVDTAQMLQRENVGKVLFIGRATELQRLVDEAARLDWVSDFLLPGVFAGKSMFDIPADYEGQVLLGYSSIPADHTVNGVREFEKLHADHDFDYANSTAQISAFVATKVLIEGLKRAGRDLSRERLMKELEGLSAFQPGLMPPMSYNARRRIGALGGYVVSLDLEHKDFGEASKWIELQP
jgi:ABC-type branched-subunit amino acid transport system substrate-binding protein